MKIGLIAEDSKLPNYALMKVFAYHKSIGDEVDFALPFEYYDDINENYERLSYFRNNKKVRIVAQPFRNPYSINDIPQWQKDMARWAMRREFYKSSDFKDFEIRKNFKCINHFKQ